MVNFDDEQIFKPIFKAEIVSSSKELTNNNPMEVTDS